jgi:hypothetical protein
MICSIFLFYKHVTLSIQYRPSSTFHIGKPLKVGRKGGIRFLIGKGMLMTMEIRSTGRRRRVTGKLVNVLKIDAYSSKILKINGASFRLKRHANIHGEFGNCILVSYSDDENRLFLMGIRGQIHGYMSFEKGKCWCPLAFDMYTYSEHIAVLCKKCRKSRRRKPQPVIKSCNLTRDRKGQRFKLSCERIDFRFRKRYSNIHITWAGVDRLIVLYSRSVVMLHMVIFIREKADFKRLSSKQITTQTSGFPTNFLWDHKHDTGLLFLNGRKIIYINSSMLTRSGSRYSTRELPYNLLSTFQHVNVDKDGNLYTLQQTCANDRYNAYVTDIKIYRCS